MPSKLSTTSVRTIVTMTGTKVNDSTQALPLSQSHFNSYFECLHDLVTNVVVTRKDGSKLSPEEGMGEAVSMLLQTHSAPKAKAMVIGNGGSAAIASHAALDLWNSCGVRATAFNDAAQLTCLSNDFGYEFVFSKAVEMFGGRDDLLLAISSSGNSASIVNAVQSAREIGLPVITFAGFNPESPLNTSGDLGFYIDSSHYGFVEIAHMALIHHLTDRLSETLRRF